MNSFLALSPQLVKVSPLERNYGTPPLAPLTEERGYYRKNTATTKTTFMTGGVSNGSESESDNINRGRCLSVMEFSPTPDKQDQTTKRIPARKREYLFSQPFVLQNHLRKRGSAKVEHQRLDDEMKGYHKSSTLKDVAEEEIQQFQMNPPERTESPVKERERPPTTYNLLSYQDSKSGKKVFKEVIRGGTQTSLMGLKEL